jgi:hypothetical protein
MSRLYDEKDLVIEGIFAGKDVCWSLSPCLCKVSGTPIFM